MSWHTEQVTLSTTAAMVRPRDFRRASLQLVNTDSSITVYLGGSSRVDSSSGFPLIAGASYKFTTAAEREVYAIAASGSPVVAWLEERKR